MGVKKEKDQYVTGNLRFLIENIDEEGVELLNPTGFTNDGIPYIEVSGLDNQCLKAIDLEFSVPIEKINESQSVQNDVSTYVPELLKFDFDVRVIFAN
ncbi:MAG: hypothetical protein Q8P20_01590 [bacterium]|nr:hypothetical protein [bacterium]